MATTYRPVRIESRLTRAAADERAAPAILYTTSAVLVLRGLLDKPFWRR